MLQSVFQGSILFDSLYFLTLCLVKTMSCSNNTRSVIKPNSIIVTGSAKTRHNRAFFNFLFIKYLHSQVYSLARSQLRMPITLRVTALWNSSNRKINLYARYWENKLQALTKTMITYEQKDVLSYNLHHRVRHE